jgi:hypothetical protein
MGIHKIPHTLSAYMAGGPPPFWSWESCVTCPAFRVQLLSTVGLLLRGTGGFNHLEGSLNSSTHTEGHRGADIFSVAALTVSILAFQKVNTLKS